MPSGRFGGRDYIKPWVNGDVRVYRWWRWPHSYIDGDKLSKRVRDFKIIFEVMINIEKNYYQKNKIKWRIYALKQKKYQKQ